jgi:hypothetical protein
MTLKEFVDQYLRKKSGDLCPEKSHAWWAKNGFLEYWQQIYQLTDHIASAVWPQRVWHIMNDYYEPVICANPNCSNSAIWSKQKSAYSQYCSKTCSSSSSTRKEKFKQTCLTKYGVTAPAKSSQVQQHRQEKSLAKHGVDHPGKTTKVKERIKNSFVEKYGVDNPSKVESIRQKTKQTFLDRYGVEYAMQNQEILDKRTKTNIEKYGAASPTCSLEIKRKQEQTLVDRYGVTNSKHINLPTEIVAMLNDPDKFSSFVTDKCMYELVEQTQLDVSTLYNYLKKYDVNHLLKKVHRSSLELMFEQFFQEHHITFVTNDRTVLKPRELDFYLPDHNLAIEICGVYWHSETFCQDRNRHYNKWLRCRELGITLLTYFDDDILQKFDVIKSKLLYATRSGNFARVGARQLNIQSIDVATERDFLNRNHIQGFLKNRNCALGAFLGDKLLAVLCLTNRKDYVEITRFAVDIDYTAPGAFSKLLAHYLRTTQYQGKIVSFSDNCHSNGSLYRSAGFEPVQELAAGYSYSLRGRPRENRQNFMKAKIAKKFGVDIEGKTEHQLMTELNYQRVWDCGKIKWQLTV